MRDVVGVGFLSLGAAHVSSDCTAAPAQAFMDNLLPPGPNLTNITKWSHKKRVCFSSLGNTDKFTPHSCLRGSKSSLISLPRNVCPLLNAWAQLCVSTVSNSVYSCEVKSKKRQENWSFITALKRTSLFSCTILIFWCLSALFLLSHVQLIPSPLPPRTPPEAEVSECNNPAQAA